MIVWDIWSFRNELVHGPKGLEEQETHKTLNKKLIEEYNKGSGNLYICLFDLHCAFQILGHVTTDKSQAKTGI